MATTSASSVLGGNANWHYDFNVGRWVENGKCCCLNVNGTPCCYKANLIEGKGVMCKKHSQLGHMAAYLRGEALARQDRDAEVLAAGQSFMQAVAAKTGKVAPATLPPKPGVHFGGAPRAAAAGPAERVFVSDRAPAPYERSYPPAPSGSNYVITRRHRSPARGYGESVFVPEHSSRQYREVPRGHYVERSHYDEPIAVSDDDDSDYVDEEQEDADDADLRRGLEQMYVTPPEQRRMSEPSVRVSVDKPASIARAVVSVESEGAPRHEVRVLSERASDRVSSVHVAPPVRARKVRRARRAGA